MDKCKGWIAMGILLRLLAVISAQPGFLNINCGGKTNYTNQNGIEWVSDANYIDVGDTGDIGNATEQTLGSSLYSLRFFPKPLNKSCYHLPVAPKLPHLLRLWFVIGNYGGFQTLPSFAYSIETVDMLAVQNTTTTDKIGVYVEFIVVTSGTVIYVCFIRTSQTDDPFITGIEMRALQDGMYGHAKPGTMLQFIARVAGNSTVRYPQDKFDRLWTSADLYFGPPNSYLETSQESVSTNNTEDLPPTAVMQNAWISNSSSPFGLQLTPRTKSLVLLYFAEIETLNMSESRTFYVTINGERKSEDITLTQNHSDLELALESDKAKYDFNLLKAGNSTRLPILNAMEVYFIVDTQPATYSQDVDALDAIKTWVDIKEWISDPCYLRQWEGIGCDSTTSPIRITEIDLSRRNLTRSVPKDIGQLTALVNVSLDNNHLMGSFPNLSNLPKLERLHLQNNNLSGTVPDWLFQLKNLTELYIENNNLSGVIPEQLLIRHSLKLNYSGNPYLCMHKGECIVKNSNKNNNKLKIVLGIALSGITVIAVTLGIILYRNKFRIKKVDAVTERSRVKKETTTFLYQDHSMIMVPNPTKSRAFSLDELMIATQTFTQEIGRGGFGSVFFGELPDGSHIAVKVLSLFSRQGAQEFLNEVDLLSRIHHRNLVSLLGYCNESREVMLIYEHMSGGSLSDHLYGSRASHSGLNWITRLKITLDAAQGLEYLHVGCTPKIIHRDIKTANILLDSNLNGKLADFGLSRMTNDGDAAHVTTAVKGTAGYLDPEYYSSQMLTHKSDVYSFGVVLLEIICGRPPIDQKLPEQELYIVRWVTPYLIEMDENDGNITEIVDKRLVGGDDMKSICRVAKVAMRCIQAEPSSRPSVTEVVAELKASISISEESTTVQSGDVLAGLVDLSTAHWSEPKEMTWSDNSSNISKVGR